MIANFALLDQAVARFDGRFTLRVLRSISSMRKSPQLQDALSTAVASLYASHQDSPDKRFLESALQKTSSAPANGDAHKEGDVLPESFIYLAVLIQVQPCLSFFTTSHL
jgi:26S proteasome regulatory subunit N3